MYDSGEEFLNELYKDLHISDIVMHTADKSDSPTTKIYKYLARLDRVVNKAHLKEHDWNLFKSLCHSKYVIKEEDIKEDYIAKKISSTISRDEVIYNTITASKDSLVLPLFPLYPSIFTVFQEEHNIQLVLFRCLIL